MNRTQTPTSIPDEWNSFQQRLVGCAMPVITAWRSPTEAPRARRALCHQPMRPGGRRAGNQTPHRQRNFPTSSSQTAFAAELWRGSLFDFPGSFAGARDLRFRPENGAFSVLRHEWKRSSENLFDGPTLP